VKTEKGSETKQLSLTVGLLVARGGSQNSRESEGISLNQLINLAVAEKISALRTEEFFRERRPRANVEKARKILKRAGKEAPREGDEISNSLRRSTVTTISTLSKTASRFE